VAISNNTPVSFLCEDLLMKCLVWLGLLPMLIALSWCSAAEPEKDVPWKAQAEIARRGAMVERVDGFQDADDPAAAISAAMQPPADDSHKWLFTLVTTKNCQWCTKMRADFENDPQVKSWVDTKDHAKSWAHWQVVQIEDQSQAWRWKDFKPAGFPALIVQPPVNGSWGDAHTIVYAHQGYLKPAELDAAIRKSIQLYAAKVFPRHLAWESKQNQAQAGVAGGFQQSGGTEQGGWTPLATPPSPLPPVPNYPPSHPYPNVPPEYPPANPTPAQPGQGILYLLLTLMGGNFLATVLLAVVKLWEGQAKSTPTKADDVVSSLVRQLLEQRVQQPRPAGPA
jgi:hypothetical protein